MTSIVQALIDNRRSPDRRSSGPLRCWVPNCGTGGRAHELAIHLSNACWPKGDLRQFKIFATSSDQEALAEARSGPCLSGIVPGMSEDNGRVSHEGQAEIAKILRDHIIFSCHDLLTDPPFSKLDLISADNVFADLDEPASQRIAMMLHYVLNPNGYLWLGAAPSMPPSLSDWFEPVTGFLALSNEMVWVSAVEASTDVSEFIYTIYSGSYLSTRSSSTGKLYS